MQQHAACGSERDRPARAREQHRAEMILKLLHRAAQRRLRDVKPVGGFREAQLLGNGLKIAQVAKFHAESCNANPA